MENITKTYGKFYEYFRKIVFKFIENFTKMCGKTLQKLIYFKKMYG